MRLRYCATLLFACQSAPPTAVVPACTFRIASAPNAETALAGEADCKTTIPLRLRVATGDPSSPTWADAVGGALRIEGEWTEDGALLRRAVIVRNTSAAPVSLVAIEWTADIAGLHADRMLHVGFQSWSYTGVETVPASLPEDRGTAKAGGGDGNVLGESAGVSWWYGVVGRDDGLGLLMGSTGAGVLRTYVAADASRVRLVVGAPGEKLDVAPGEARTLDDVVAALGEGGALLEAYARAASVKHPPTSPRKPPLAGWGSWNLYYDTPTAPLLRDEIAWAKATLAPLGMRDFLLDDGYEPFWGDWFAKPEFGEDLGAFAAEVQSAGLVPAIWLAPFYADVRSATFQSHPDWFVQGSAGNPLTIAETFGQTFGVLDPTNDAVRAHLTTLFADLFVKGYRTFKLDFLYAGAIIGRRATNATGLEALALGLRAIREAVPAAHLVGCGAPQLPSLGWFDSMRIGPDIAFKTSPEPKYGFISSESRSIAFRGHTDAWWALDPDVVLLRGAGIDDAVAWTHVVASAMSGGNYLLGDGRQASPSRLAMALGAEVLALAREATAGRPVDAFAQMDAGPIPSPIVDPKGTGRVPHLLRKRSADGKRTWLAVFAWDDEAYAPRLELPKGAVEIFPDGSTHGAPASGADGKAPVAVSMNGARLFRW